MRGKGKVWGGQVEGGEGWGGGVEVDGGIR